jgi:penicillin-binding protein 1A
LKDLPVEDRPVPEGLLQVGSDYYYVENPPGAGVRSLGLGQEEKPKTQEEATKDEVKNELF